MEAQAVPFIPCYRLPKASMDQSNYVWTSLHLNLNYFFRLFYIIRASICWHMTLPFNRHTFWTLLILKRLAQKHLVLSVGHNHWHDTMFRREEQVCSVFSYLHSLPWYLFNKMLQHICCFCDTMKVQNLNATCFMFLWDSQIPPEN